MAGEGVGAEGATMRVEIAIVGFLFFSVVHYVYYVGWGVVFGFRFL